MITNIILLGVYYGVYAITYPLRYFNNISLPSEITSSIASIAGNLKVINTIAPVYTILTIFGLVLAIDTAIFSYKMTMWIIKRLPTQS